MLKYAQVIRPLKVTNRSDDQVDQSRKAALKIIQQRIEKAQDQAYIKARLGRKSKLMSMFQSKLAGIATRLRARLKQDVSGYIYDYSSYKAPTQPGDVVIAFSGARQGPGTGLDLELKRRYGKNNYAIFRPVDVDKALEFASTLPKGCKLYVQGLSHGGDAAVKFAQSGIPIQRLITYDAVSQFGQPQQKPKNVKKWYNAVAGDYHYQDDSNILTYIPKWIKSVASDTAVDYMGRWGQIQGANNFKVNRASHVDVKQMYKVLNKQMKDTIMKNAQYKYGMVKVAKEDWLKVVQDWAKKAPSEWNKLTSQHRWIRPTAYGLVGGLLTLLLSGGMKSGFWRILSMLAGGAGGALLGMHHNTQQDIQNLSKHSINTLSKRLDQHEDNYNNLKTMVDSGNYQLANRVSQDPEFGEVLVDNPGVAETLDAGIPNVHNPYNKWDTMAKL